MNRAGVRRFATAVVLIQSSWVAFSEPAPALTRPAKPVVSVHSRYTVTQRYAGEAPETFIADYWQKASQSRYTVAGSVTRSFIVTESEWIVYVIDSAAHTSTLTVSPRTAPANRSAQELLGPAETLAEIPFLGFAQPGKVYRSAGLAAAHSAGTTLTDSVPDEYLTDGNTKQLLLLGVELHYDIAGRLTLYQRDGNVSEGYAESYAYSNFAFVPGFGVIPKSVTFTRKEPRSVDGRLRETYREDYRVTAMEYGDKATGIFDIATPLVGTQVIDYRYSGKVGMGLTYRYDGKVTIDEQSRALSKN